MEGVSDSAAVQPVASVQIKLFPSMSNIEVEQVERLQNQILQTAAKWNRPLTDAARAAFRAMPRHAFVKRFRMGDKVVTVTPDNLLQLLPTIYNDGVLNLWKDQEKGLWSTMSQPSLVLGMLSLMNLAEGHRVFELGAGSGWNAAMLGHIVGAKGHVTSVEIIPEMADAARQAIAERGIENVDIVTGDAGDGFAAGAPYDRAMFTAGSYDLPRAFHEQVREGGLLLMVVKVEGGGDQLILLEKKAECFESIRGLLCAFVPMTGRHAFAGAHPIPIEALPRWPELAQREVDRRPFWWGASDKAPFWAATGVRSFLSIAEPLFRVFRDDVRDPLDPQHWYCGLFDPEAHSLAVAKYGKLVSYGSVVARDRLLLRLHEWIDLGMPTMAAMHLRVFPADVEVRAEKNKWIVRRNESIFVWSLQRPGEARSGAG
jgi:protein-L-isoaspartate(D-aspartate) O-methyltransferase